MSCWKGSWVNWYSFWGALFLFVLFLANLYHLSVFSLGFLQNRLSLGFCSLWLLPPWQVVFSLAFILILPASLVHFFLHSFRSVTSWVWEWHSVCFAWIVSSRYKVGACSRWLSQVQKWTLSSWWSVCVHHPVCEVGAFFSVSNPAWSQCLFRVLVTASGQCISSWLHVSGLLPWCWVGALCHGVTSVLFFMWSSRYMSSSFGRVLGHCHFVVLRHCISLLPVLLVMSMYHAYCIQYLNPTLLVLIISCFSPDLPLLARRGLSHHSILSIPNKNPRFGTICGETALLEGWEPIINTPAHHSQHFKWTAWESAVIAWGV